MKIVLLVFFFAQVYANTPDSVFQLLALLKELLLLLHQDYILPALAYLSALFQRVWLSLQDSCKSVPSGTGISLSLTLVSAFKLARLINI